MKGSASPEVASRGEEAMSMCGASRKMMSRPWSQAVRNLAKNSMPSGRPSSSTARRMPSMVSTRMRAMTSGSSTRVKRTLRSFLPVGA